MKILHVIPSLSQQRGGPSFAVRAMSEAVVRDGVEVHIVATDDDGANHATIPLEQPLVENGITYRYFHRQTKFYTVSWPLTRWLWQHVHEYDLLHIHSLFSYSTLAAAWLAHWNHVPYIIRPLGHLNQWGMQNRRAVLKRFSLRWIEQPILQRATLLHLTCEQERLEAQQVGVAGPSLVAPLGIDTAPFQHLPSAEDFLARYPQTRNKVRLLFLSRVDPKKGLDLLLAAFAQAQKIWPDTSLIIAGDGDAAYIRELKTLAQQLNIVDAIIWTGFIAGMEKLMTLAAADLFVLPSYSENFGIAVVEAMAAGLPVVISDQVGIHREVTKSCAGLVASCQADELAANLMQLISDPDQRKMMGSKAKRLTEENFSQTAMKRHLLAMYDQVLSKVEPVHNVISPSTIETNS